MVFAENVCLQNKTFKHVSWIDCFFCFIRQPSIQTRKMTKIFIKKMNLFLAYDQHIYKIKGAVECSSWLFFPVSRISFVGFLGRKFYIFWISCRVASISSCSNLFFSRSSNISSELVKNKRRNKKKTTLKIKQKKNWLKK